MKKITLLIIGLLLIFALLIGCNSTKVEDKPVIGKNDDGAELSLDKIANLQPGTAEGMFDIGNRAWVLYYAGIDGNWDLAMYELEETEESFDRITVTRPKRKDAIESYIETYLKPLQSAVESKDSAAFKTAFDKATKGCNACHKASDKKFVNWQLPTNRPPYLSTKPVK